MMMVSLRMAEGPTDDRRVILVNDVCSPGRTIERPSTV